MKKKNLVLVLRKNKDCGKTGRLQRVNWCSDHVPRRQFKFDKERFYTFKTFCQTFAIATIFSTVTVATVTKKRSMCVVTNSSLRNVTVMLAS